MFREFGMTAFADEAALRSENGSRKESRPLAVSRIRGLRRGWRHRRSCARPTVRQWTRDGPQATIDPALQALIGFSLPLGLAEPSRHSDGEGISTSPPLPRQVPDSMSEGKKSSHASRRRLGRGLSSLMATPVPVDRGSAGETAEKKGGKTTPSKSSGTDLESTNSRGKPRASEKRSESTPDATRSGSAPQSKSAQPEAKHVRSGKSERSTSPSEGAPPRKQPGRGGEVTGTPAKSPPAPTTSAKPVGGTRGRRDATGMGGERTAGRGPASKIQPEAGRTGDIASGNRDADGMSPGAEVGGAPSAIAAPGEEVDRGEKAAAPRETSDGVAKVDSAAEGSEASEAAPGAPLHRDGEGAVSGKSVNVESSKPGDDAGDTVLRYIPLRSIRPNPHQPRKQFRQEGLESLAVSIRQSGLMQPILVRPAGVHRSAAPVEEGSREAERSADGGSRAGSTFRVSAQAAHEVAHRYELIAGERRWRAAELAGLTEIPAVVHDLDDQAAAEWAVVENLQREELDPIERAEAFMRLQDDFGLTPSQIGERVGMDRSSVANLMRLVGLDEATKEEVRGGLLSMGHARALLSLEPVEVRRRLARASIAGEWSVRTLEAKVGELRGNGTGVGDGIGGEGGHEGAKAAGWRGGKPGHIVDLEREISASVGLPVEIRLSRKRTAGRVVLRFGSLEEFERLAGHLQKMSRK